MSLPDGAGTRNCGERSSSVGWNHHRIRDDFLALDLDDGFAMRLQRMERLSRGNTFFLASNEELCETLRCSKNTLSTFLQDAEKDGWIKRVLIPSPNGQYTGRHGIIWTKRPTDRPVIPPEKIAATEADVSAEPSADPRSAERCPSLPGLTQSLGTAVPNGRGACYPTIGYRPHKAQELRDGGHKGPGRTDDDGPG